MTGECFYCGKAGHRSSECRTKDKYEAKKKVGEQRKKKSTGKGKGKDKTCEMCGVKGHTIKECRSERDIRALPSADGQHLEKPIGALLLHAPKPVEEEPGRTAGRDRQGISYSF